MPVIAHVVLRGVTPAQYDAVRAACGWLDDAPDGGLGHLAWWEGGDNHNMDAWESEEAFGRFGEELLRIDPAHHIAGLRLNAWVSLIGIVVGVTWYVLSQRDRTPTARRPRRTRPTKPQRRMAVPGSRRVRPPG